MGTRILTRFTAAVLVAAGCLASAAAAPSASNDDVEVRAYAPTDAKFHAYLAATQAAQSAAAHDAALQAEAEQVASEQGSGSLAQWQQIYARHPRYFAFFKSQGLNEHETAIWNNLLPWMMQYADSDPSQRAVTGATMSKGQVAFADAHMADLKKLLAQFAAQATH